MVVVVVVVQVTSSKKCDSNRPSLDFFGRNFLKCAWRWIGMGMSEPGVSMAYNGNWHGTTSAWALIQTFFLFTIDGYDGYPCFTQNSLFTFFAN